MTREDFLHIIQTSLPRTKQMKPSQLQNKDKEKNARSLNNTNYDELFNELFNELSQSPGALCQLAASPLGSEGPEYE